MAGNNLVTWRPLLASGLVLVVLGALLAHSVQTAGGSRILDVRFAGSHGNLLSGLLYVPQGATPQNPAPGILAVHGYFNSREAQGDFAIEFARRGYVVLAIDQMGHGHSDPPAFAYRFGGPDGLAYLRSLQFVDKDNIGLEGHSMGGWAVVNAAAAFPSGYRAVVLEGSSTGAPFSADGTAQFPRNVAVVFSKFDEFASTMWGVASAQDVASSPKLGRLFGTDRPVIPGRLYGSIEQGTGRMLYTPPGTHPMDHISRSAIGDSLDWFQRTLHGGHPRPPSDQIWPWREVGTLTALMGLLVLLLGVVEFLLSTASFVSLRATAWAGREVRDASWWLALLVGTALPAITLLPFFQIGSWIPASHFLPQAFTNEIITWALLNGVLLLILSTRLRSGPRPAFQPAVAGSVALALLSAAVIYIVVCATDFFLNVDFRVWFMAFKPMSPSQVRAFVVYVVPLTFYFIVALRALHSAIPVRTDSTLCVYAVNILALTLGVCIFLALEYGSLISTHQLRTLFMNDPLRIIVAINFLPLMTGTAIVSTFIFRRTNSYLPGALLCGILVAWYAVVGQAMQAM